jgi:apolipoprotein N-acyltransferase
MAALRCVENRVPMARSVNSGLSGFIDSYGRVLSLLDKPLQGGWTVGVPYDWAVGQADLPLDGRQTIYGRIGNLLGWLAAVWTGVLTGAALWIGRSGAIAGVPAGKERT